MGIVREYQDLFRGSIYKVKTIFKIIIMLAFSLSFSHDCMRLNDA